jgi:PAS domain S-box-containing protein
MVIGKNQFIDELSNLVDSLSNQGKNQETEFLHKKLYNILTSLRDDVYSSESVFRTIWEKSNEAMRITDCSGVVVICNEAYAKLTGFSVSDLQGKLFSEVYDPDKAEINLLRYKHNFENNEIKRTKETRVNFKNKTEVYLEISNTFIDDLNGGRNY